MKKFEIITSDIHNQIKKSAIAKHFGENAFAAVAAFFNAIGKRRAHLLDATFVREATSEEAHKHVKSFSNICKAAIFSVDEKEYIVVLNEGAKRYSVAYRKFYEGERPVRIMKKKFAEEAAFVVNFAKEKNVLRNDCQIRTLATVLETNYKTMSAFVQAQGWSERNVGNFRSKHFTKAFATFEKSRTIAFDSTKEGTQKMTVNSAALKFNEGTYFAACSGHVLAIVDGVVHDHSDTRNMRVERLFKVIDKVVKHK